MGKIGEFEKTVVSEPLEEPLPTKKKPQKVHKVKKKPVEVSPLKK